MRVKLFTLRFTATLGGFDERPIQEFARDKEVLAFREHFFSVNDVPHLACILTWQDAVVGAEDLQVAREIRESRSAPIAAKRPEKRTPSDPTAGMNEPDRLLFNSLRTWRAAKARTEGVPPYVVFTNRELVEIVMRRPSSATALTNVPGIGPGKVERHGTEVLGIINGSELAPATATEPATEAPS